MAIVVEFDGLEDLSPAELKASLVRFTEAREQYVREGRHGLAAMFNGLLCALAGERDRRGLEFKKAKADLLGVDLDDNDWTPEINSKG